MDTGQTSRCQADGRWSTPTGGMKGGGGASVHEPFTNGTRAGGTKDGAEILRGGSGPASGFRLVAHDRDRFRDGCLPGGGRGAGERIRVERVTQRVIGIDRLFHRAAEVEVADFVQRVLDVLQVGIAHHLVDMGLEFAGHAARLLHKAADGAQCHRQVLWADDDQRHGGDDGDFRPREVEHEE